MSRKTTWSNIGGLFRPTRAPSPHPLPLHESQESTSTLSSSPSLPEQDWTPVKWRPNGLAGPPYTVEAVSNMLHGKNSGVTQDARDSSSETKPEASITPVFTRDDLYVEQDTLKLAHEVLNSPSSNPPPSPKKDEEITQSDVQVNAELEPSAKRAGVRPPRSPRTCPKICVNCQVSGPCDGQYPCQSCSQLQQAGLCVYEVGDLAPKTAFGNTSGDHVRDRIMQLENFVQALRKNFLPDEIDLVTASGIAADNTTPVITVVSTPERPEANDSASEPGAPKTDEDVTWLRKTLEDQEKTIADMKEQHWKEVSHLHEQITNMMKELKGGTQKVSQELADVKAQVEKKTNELENAQVEIAKHLKEATEARAEVGKQAEQLASMSARLSKLHPTLQAIQTIARDADLFVELNE
ncbi:hypothetical protein EIP91_004162 [Steccherinum ochraceum]|uniref:Zn(2)-C6 fungal-type domain-containing protein n=1 Tax=Steccherinum ochraceum TaxID=92696 RepID=A0A4R0RNM0_9APHY|nr:hypothetical protein EIP91_004162 [Steccherinum ochraceum]